MKIISFLLVAALSLNQVIGVKVNVKEDLKITEKWINESKIKIEDTIKDINRYRSNIQFIFNNKIKARQEQDVKNIRCMTDLLLEEIRTFVHDAKIKGKNPTQCYVSSQATTRIISNNGYSSLDKCTKNAQIFIEQFQTTIDDVITIGQTLTTDLDHIFSNCYIHLPKVMLRCIKQNIKELEVCIKNFESSITSMKTSGDTAFHQGYLNGIACYNNVIVKTREGVRNTLAEAEYCINNS
ncbi:uncharacterized protein LOC124957754 isoform X1 [Vespa velutina]|uniref:uncharacterized protein LOC124957754 isoform X1 n=1 Tax=Vespa velutina TaxID=202808 RepID=UPI001FB4D6CA|nr:uncharacterized protein LOC124957754 isoform X1 [Vespa velutina]